MKPRERGFTFVEVLIALAIVGALLAIAFGGLRVGLAAWRQGEDRAEAHQHIRGVALSLERAIGGSYPYTGPRWEAPEAQLLFSGAERRIEFVTQTAPFAFPVPVAFTAVVIEFAEGEQPGLVIRQRPLPNRNPFTETAVMLHDPTITTLAFAYMDDGGAWRDTWDTDADKTLPRAIRVTLGTNALGRPETLPPITVALRILAP